jgi:predicted DNA-binding protein YlxM (UPF0122 family)
MTPYLRSDALDNKMIVSLERFRGESGVQMIEVESEAKSHSEERAYPDVEELGVLWSLLKNEKKDMFIRTLSERLDFLHKIHDLNAALPLPAVAAMELLTLEAVRYFAVDAAEYMIPYRLLYSSLGISGTLWLSNCLRLFERVFDSRSAMKQSRFSVLIEQVNSYIEAHFIEDLSLTRLAEMVHYNPSYLSRLYKEQTGKALMDYINELRIHKAKRLLRDTTKSIG